MYGVGRVPGLRRLPVLKLVAVAEIALIARDHVARLDATERRRFLQLLRQARFRPGNLSEREREEFATLVRKTEPRLFAGLAADRLSPVRLPRRIVHGPKPKRRRRG